MLLLIAPLAIGMASADKDYNSAKSNTSTAIQIELFDDDDRGTSDWTMSRWHLQEFDLDVGDLDFDYNDHSGAERIRGEISIDNDDGTEWTITNHFEESGADVTLIRTASGLIGIHNGHLQYDTTVTGDHFVGGAVGEGVPACAWNSHGTPESTTEGCEIVVYDDEGGEALRTGIVVLNGGGSNCLQGQSIFTKDETIHIIEEDDSGSAIVIIEKTNKTTVIVDGEVVAIWGHGLIPNYDGGDWGILEYNTEPPVELTSIKDEDNDADGLATDEEQVFRIATPGIDHGSQGQFYEESSYKPIRVPVLTPEASNSTGGPTCGDWYGDGFFCIPKLDGSLITDGSGGWILATHDEVSDSDNVIIDTEDAWLIVDDSKLEMFMPKDMDVLEYMDDQADNSRPALESEGAVGNEFEGSNETQNNSAVGGKGPSNQTDNNNSEEQSHSGDKDCEGVCWGPQQSREDQSDTTGASFRTGIVILTGGGSNCMQGTMIFDNKTDDTQSNVSNMHQGAMNAIRNIRASIEDPISGTGYTIMQDETSTRIIINGEMVGMITHEDGDDVERTVSHELCDGMDNNCDASKVSTDLDSGLGEEVEEESALSSAADAIVPDDPATAVAVGTGVAGLAGAAGTMFGRRGAGGALRGKDYMSAKSNTSTAVDKDDGWGDPTDEDELGANDDVKMCLHCGSTDPKHYANPEKYCNVLDHFGGETSVNSGDGSGKGDPTPGKGTDYNSTRSNKV